MKSVPVKVFVALIIFIVATATVLADQFDLDYPHNATNTINCWSCHYYSNNPAEWAKHTPQDIDDTPWNKLCWDCHNDTDADYVKTHSSLAATDTYGTWTLECKTCHWAHHQSQLRTYGAESYLYTATTDQASATTLTRSGGAAWTANEYEGYLVIPNISQRSYNYKILSNTEDTLTVEGPIDTAKLTEGNSTLAIIYGKLIRSTIATPYRVVGQNRYLYTAITAAAAANVLTMSGGAAWQVNKYVNYIVLPNINEPNYEYLIVGNTEDSLTVRGDIDLSKVTPTEDTLAIYRAVSSKKTVKLFDSTGAHSFADGDSTYDGVCEVCHTQPSHFRNNGNATDQLHTNFGGKQGTDCIECHQHTGFGHGGGGGCGGAIECHGEHGPHLAHTGAMVGIGCGDCHDTDDYPNFNDSQDLANTTACDTCHSADGADLAKQYFHEANGWAATEGEASFCGSCHDATPGYNGAAPASNIMGDKSTYGYYITGHGRNTAFARLAWQDNSAPGNPAADQTCNACHNLSTNHFGPANSRLKTGYLNDADNSNCKQCHDPGNAAVGNPQWYTTYAAYQSSAHSGKKCSDCHDVHGATGAYKAMAMGMVAVDSPTNAANLCYQCHKDPGAGGIENIAISGSAYNNDIMEAFAESTKHPLGASYTISGSTYTLQCTSCHNVHLVTGKYWQADTDKTPVTRISTPADPDGNLTIWGDDANEKMKAYAEAAGGTYEPPAVTANTYDSAKLPDYTTFCLDCHASAINAIVAKDWTGNPHGKKTAGLTNMISGGGISGALYAGPVDCPNYLACGRAWDWSDDTCDEAAAEAAGDNNCWPVIPKGAGTSAILKGAYDPAERNAGVNYILSCTDCHEAHGSEKYELMRKALNRARDIADIELDGDQHEWDFAAANTLGVCYQCHYPKTREHSYNPGWHNDTTCASGPCHQPSSGHPAFGHGTCWGRCHSTTYVYNTDLINDPAQHATFHENKRGKLVTQLAPAHEPGLVFHYKFENNTKDSNMWNLHGLFINGSGSYVGGRVGNAVQVSNNPIEVGAANAIWDSTNYGITGNTSKLTEMKYNMSVEGWVYPTSDPSDGFERKIMAKHNYWEGGYALVLRPIDGEYRLGLLTNVDLGGPTQNWDWLIDSCNGLRGSYSSVAIPLNQWTHVAATFDTAGPDGTSDDLSVGRIRIYVNGEDVTTSDVAEWTCWAQPQAGEDHITPYPDMMFKDPADCGGWCATALSVGGLNWSAADDNFIGRLDEAKLWYTTKDTAYFDSQAGPRILGVEGIMGSNTITVTFSEGSYANTGGTGALQPSDFVFTDTDNGRTITNVTHAAGESTATLTLSSPLDTSNDINVDTLAFFAADSAFDDYDNPADTLAVTLKMTSACPTGQTVFDLNESAGSTYVMDNQSLLYGVVNDPGDSMGSGYFTGDGVNNYIAFDNGNTCLEATTALTLEARVYPTGIPIDGSTYQRRIFNKAGNNYQMSVWRNPAWANFTPPDNVVSMSLWMRVADTSDGLSTWRVALTNYDTCPIVSDHWYKVTAVLDSSKAGGIPVDIFVDDQGTDGNGAGENWTGYINCTKSDQAYTNSGNKLYVGASILSADGQLAISAASNIGVTARYFLGKTDWVKQESVVDYTGVDDPPN